jgi:hypothetical protein
MSKTEKAKAILSAARASKSAAKRLQRYLPPNVSKVRFLTEAFDAYTLGEILSIVKHGEI